MSREEDHKRISALAGVDESGAILPPPEGMRLDQSPSSFWRTTSFRVLQLNPLTPREVEVLTELSQGDPVKIVAASLGVGKDTINRHLRNMFNKTGKRNTAGLVALALREGWIK